MEKDTKARKTARKHTVLYNKIELNIPRKFTCRMKEPVCIYKVHPCDVFAYILLAMSSCPVHCVCHTKLAGDLLHSIAPFFCLPHAILHELKRLHVCMLVSVKIA